MKTFLGQIITSALVCALLFTCQFACAQTFVFNTAGASGNFGPDQSQIDTAYSTTNLNGMVISNNGVQSWTVPQSGVYRITAIGAAGGGSPPMKFGGRGTQMTGNFNLLSGTVLEILVGQQGSTVTGCFGGGGGSFVSLANAPLIIAGGGGGAGGIMNGNGVDATIGTNGTAGVAGGSGGINGNGGVAANTNGGSGAGFFTDGTGNFYMPECSTSVGKAFVNGGFGGQFDDWEPGGFGGGGSAWSGNGNGGGGGGYSGGGTSGSYFFGGGGGGSFNSGTDQNNQSGVCAGNGIITLTRINVSPVDVAPNGESLGTGTILATTTNTTITTGNVELAKDVDRSLHVYPNPNSGIFKVVAHEYGIGRSLKLFSSIGKLVYEKKMETGSEFIDLTQFGSGIYFISIGDSRSHKLIIQ
jgi:hypothetical protein